MRTLRCMFMVGALLCAGARAANPAPPTPLVMAATLDTDASPDGAALHRIYTEALRRLNYRLVLRAYPAKRASIMADQGQVDGEIHRVAEYGLSHPNLVRVDSSHFSLLFSAYAREPLELGNGWNALKGGSYRAEYAVGTRKCEVELPKVVAPDRLSVVASDLLGLRKLALGRTDLFIDVDSVVQTVLALPEFQGTPIRKVALMEEVKAYAYLHNRHKALAGRLAEVLNEMKREGRIEQIRAEQQACRVKPGGCPSAAQAPAARPDPR